MGRIRDPRARWWLVGGAVPVALVLFVTAWVLWFDPEDDFGAVLVLWMAPSLFMLPLVRLPSWAFRLVAIPILIVELIFGVIGRLLLLVWLLHLVALFTRRPPPLAELRRA